MVQLLVVPGAGAREVDRSTPPPDGAITWWDVGPGDERPVFVDEFVFESLARPTLMPLCEVTASGLSLVVHSLDAQGHLLQIGILAGERMVTTVHSAFNDAVSRESLFQETEAVSHRLMEDGAGVGTANQLVAAILHELASTLTDLLNEAAARSGRLDRTIRDERIRDQESVLEALFEVRRDLFTIRNRLAQTSEIAQAAMRYDKPAFKDVVAEFERLVRMCDGERDFFQGVLDYYEQRINVKINFATERLALIAALVLPLSAVSGILGMNTIVQDETNVPLTIVMVSLMVMMVGALLYWSKRKDWW